MDFSAMVLDKYGAPKLSQLTVCTAPEIDEPPNHLGNFVINSLTVLSYEDPLGRIILMFGRRVEHAVREYRMGRDLLVSYIAQLQQTNSHFLRAMRAITHFEQCVGSICQAAGLADALFQALPKLQQPPPDDCERRLRLIWNRAKHFDEDLEQELTKSNRPDVTAPVWLTNDGIECINASVSFTEVHSVLIDLLSALEFFSTDLPTQLVERRSAVTRETD
jgi:hypothetical protein